MSQAAAGTAALWSPSITYTERFNTGDSHSVWEEGEKPNISPLGREIHSPGIPVYKLQSVQAQMRQNQSRAGNCHQNFLLSFFNQKERKIRQFKTAVAAELS